MIYDIPNETMPREDLEKVQLKRLQALCERVYANVPFYRKKFDQKGVKPQDIKSLNDITLLPFTVKQDLRDQYPFGLFSVPMDQITRIHSSSGTTGTATVVGYTKRDIANWGELMARSFMAAGACAADTVQNAYGYGLFTGGLGVHYGAETLGATVVPTSGGATRRQVTLLKDFTPDVICCTPSYALFLAETGKEMGIDINKLPLRIGIFGAEPWTNAMRLEIEKELGIKAIDIYGLSEIMGPGVATECQEAQNGLHIQEDHFLAEIINPQSGEPVGPGEEGELVFTTLTKEGIPLIRYRTRDLTTLNTTPCKCGRTTARMNRIAGRSDDMLIIRGVNVFPSQIESILIETEGLTPHYRLIVDRSGNLDTLEIQVEISDSIFSDEIKNLQRLETKVMKNIKEFLGVTAKVRFVNPKEIERSTTKANRIIDKRKEA